MRPTYIKVKTVAIAINPTDGYHIESPGIIGRVGGILGCDLSGIVEEVGEECVSDVAKGDRVYGSCHGGNLSGEEDGAFAEYAMVRDGLIAKIPDNLSFEEAATLGVGLSTIAQALYINLGLQWPDENEQDLSNSEDTKPRGTVLIYGGSTATGTLAIQFAKLSGYTVITTASPDHFDLVKSRGADAIFNHRDPECAAQIRKYTQESIRFILDTISTSATYATCTACLPTPAPPLGSSDEIRLVNILDLDFPVREDINNSTVLAYTANGEGFWKYGEWFEERRDHHEITARFWRVARRLLAEGRVRPHPVGVREGGWEAVPEGVQHILEKKVRGEKLVYRVG